MNTYLHNYLLTYPICYMAMCITSATTKYLSII